jgi:hypothetical protein
MATRKRPKKEGRLHLRVDAALVTQMHEYARRHSTDITALTTKHFLELLAAEKLASYPEAEQV